MRSTRWAAMVAAIAVGVLAGCAGVEGTTQEGAGAAPGTTQGSDSEPVSDTSSEAPEPEPSTEEPTTEEPAELGTRENPATPGEDIATFSTGAEEIEVELGEATWDANEIVALENQFNDPPGDGMVYVLLPVTATYHGPESMLPWIDLKVTFLADNGRSYESTYAVIPDDLSDVADVYDGGTATGNILFALPTDQLPGGMWGVSYNWSDPLWWAAA